jgi:riboflavin synthase
MFTGIIESTAKLEEIRKEGTNIHFEFSSKVTGELKVDQSVAHNGVCLTVTEIKGNRYSVTAIDETLQKTSLKNWDVGHQVNLERCMPADGRFDGHIVQGHVDTVGSVENIEDKNGSWEITISYNDSENITVKKGSICINGISLTVVNSDMGSFSVAIIPYTWEHTNMHLLKKGDLVNLEFDIVGKYLQKMMQLKDN